MGRGPLPTSPTSTCLSPLSPSPDSSLSLPPPSACPQTANFSDTANVLASPNLTEWAAAKTLWRPATGEFSFFDAFHAKGASDATANREY